MNENQCSWSMSGQRSTFNDILHNDVDGMAIGMQYFRSRGFRDDIIRKFQLGFCLSSRHAFC